MAWGRHRQQFRRPRSTPLHFLLFPQWSQRPGFAVHACPWLGPGSVTNTPRNTHSRRLSLPLCLRPLLVERARLAWSGPIREPCAAPWQTPVDDNEIRCECLLNSADEDEDEDESFNTFESALMQGLAVLALPRQLASACC